MPGYIKVNGSQQPVASPYVKVNGSWTPSALGYVKVSGEWKIWHSAKIEDTFDRAGSADLGTASNGFSQWTELSGSWGIQSTQAYHDNTAGPAIAVTQLYKATTDYKVSVDIQSNTGLGIAFWVEDADNWHAAIPGVRTQNDPGYYYCPSGYSLSGTTCTQSYNYAASYESDSTYSATYNSGDPIYGCPATFTEYSGGCRKIVDVFNGSVAADCTSTTTYSCPSNCSRSGTTCNCTSSPSSSTSTTSLGCQDASLCGRAGGSCGSACTGGGCRCTKSTTVCKCGSTTVSCGSTCSYTTTATSKTTTTCTCPNSDYTLSGSTCYVTYYDYEYANREVIGYGSPYYSCPSGGSLSGSTCTITGRGYYCPSGGTLQGSTCYVSNSQSASYQPPSTSYPSVARIYKNVSGTIAEVFTQDIGFDPKSFEVVTSGNNVNLYSYSGLGLTGTKITSNTYSAPNPVRTTIVGIAKYGNQVQRQGNYIDNFKAE